MRLFSDTTTTKSIYFWNMLGNFSNALLTVLSMMVVTRSLTSYDADIFSIGWAISQLMATIGTFQVRMYQATDINGKFSFNQYFKFRILCLFLMILTSIFYVMYRGYDNYKGFIILLLCIFRAIDCFADLYEGWFQQKGRLDFSGQSLFLRVIISLLVLVVTAFLTQNLTIMCISLVLSYFISFYFFDIRIYHKFYKSNEIRRKKNNRWLIEIFKETLPLFINSFLAISIMNAPKDSIDLALQNGLLDEGAQTIYSVLFMPASFLTLFYMVFRPLITEMAVSWDRGEVHDFLKKLKKIVIILILFSILVLVVAYFLGCLVLSLFYGINLDRQAWNLIIILLGGCFYTFACILDNTLLILRRQHVLVISYVLTWILSKIISDFFVNLSGIHGGALAYMLSMLLFLLSIIILFFIEFRKARINVNRNDKENH